MSKDGIAEEGTSRKEVAALADEQLAQVVGGEGVMIDPNGGAAPRGASMDPDG